MRNSNQNRSFIGRLVPVAVVSFSIVLGAAAIHADEAPKKKADKPAAKSPESKPGEKKRSLDGYREQIADDEARLIERINKPTAEDEKKHQALSWYMMGHLRNRKADFKGALDAFEKAVELDPNSPASYRALVPLCFSLKRIQEGLKYANKVVELDPDDFQMCLRLGQIEIAQRKFESGLKFFEQALGSKRLNHRSAEYVLLNRELAVIYGASGKFPESAECYEVVFSALTEKGKFDLEFRIYRQLLGDRETTFERMGETFLAAKNTGMAIKAFEEASKARAGRPGTLNYNLALVYFETKKYGKARSELQKYFDAQLQSKGLVAYQLLAKILDAAKKSDELIGELKKLAKADSRNHTLQFFLADKLLEAKQLDEAQAIFESVLEVAKEPAALVGLVSVYRRLEKPAKLIDVLSKVKGVVTIAQLQNELAETTKNEAFRDQVVEAAIKLNAEQIESLGAEGNHFLAQVAADAKKNETAEKFFKAALEARPRRENARDVYQNFGAFLFDIDDYKQAITVFESASKNLDLAGQRPLFLFRLSYAYELSGKTEDALTAIRDAKRLAPDAALLYHQEGWVYYHSHQWEDAIKTFNRVIERFASDKEMVRRCKFSLSNVYIGMEQKRKAEEVLEEVLDESPDDPSVNNDLGYLYAEQGRHLEKAESMIRKAVKAEPENAAYLDSMGWVLYMRGKHKEAAEWLEKAQKLPSGDDPTILEHLADCYQKLDRKDEARQLWQTALDGAQKATKPDEKLVKRLQDKLGKSE